MKPEEIIAQNYLSSLARGAVQFEPDGNVPPDFSLDNVIGAEVRRLNQHFFSQEDAEGLELVTIPLHNTFQTILRSYDERYDGTSYWIAIDYRRPLRGRRKDTASEMSRVIDSFLAGDRRVPCSLNVNDVIQFRIHPSRPISGRLFRHIASSDWDSGGWVVPMYIQNIAHCIVEKGEKIEPYAQRYKEWWLVLVDAMGWGLEPDEINELKAGITDLGRFAKICIIDHQNGNCLLELP